MLEPTEGTFEPGVSRWPNRRLSPHGISEINRASAGVISSCSAIQAYRILCAFFSKTYRPLLTQPAVDRFDGETSGKFFHSGASNLPQGLGGLLSQDDAGNLLQL
jgi:hypothetical protein